MIVIVENTFLTSVRSVYTIITNYSTSSSTLLTKYVSFEFGYILGKS